MKKTKALSIIWASALMLSAFALSGCGATSVNKTAQAPGIGSADFESNGSWRFE